MSKKNGRLHSDRLLESPPDVIALGQAVEEGFIDLCSSFLRIVGEPLTPPSDLDSDMYRWRKMRVRHKSGDFRNTESELKSTQAVAQWTVDVQRKMRNQEPIKIEWAS